MNAVGEQYAGVVFDMDGILIDSEPLYRMAAQQAASDLGHLVTDDIYVMWMGLPPSAVEASVSKSMGPDFPMRQFGDRFREIWMEHTDQHGVPAQPGMNTLLMTLRARGIPFAVATSTQRDQAERSLEMAGLWSNIDCLVAGNEVDEGKPAPEIFLHAAEAIGIHPTRCVALEDSEAIMVPDLHQPSPEVTMLADYVLPTTTRAARVVLALLGIH